VPDLFGAVDHLTSAMTFHRERHTVIAGNLANLDTPGFRPVDLVRPEAAAAVAPVTTHDGHIASSPTEPAVSFDDGGALQGADGNAVSLERELAKVDANRVRYNTSSELVSRRLALLRYAAGDGI
jgi:flagellar basal-body rod protein FlgB